MDHLKAGTEIKLKEIVPDGYDPPIIEVKAGEVTTEINPDAEGYYNFTVGNQDITITVTNERDVTIDTGIFTDSLPFIIILVFAIFAISVIVIRKRIYKAKADWR